MPCIETAVKFGDNNYIEVTNFIISTILQSGVATQQSEGVFSIGNSDHLLKIYYPGSGIDILFELKDITNSSNVKTSGLNMANTGWVYVKMVYSQNGFGLSISQTFYSTDSVDIVAIKGVSSQNSEVWLLNISGTDFFINGSNIAHKLTNTNLVYNSPSGYKGSVALAYNNATKAFAAKVNLLAGVDSLGALTSGGIAANAVVNINNNYYLWRSSAENLYVSDRLFD